MLAVSRQLNPECEHLRGDMRTVRLGRTFDAVFVHDAVDYMTDRGRPAAGRWGRPSRTAGPAASRCSCPITIAETFEPGPDTAAATVPTGVASASSTGSGTPTPTTRRSLTEYAFLLRDADGAVRVVHETHRTGLFGRETWLRLLADAGFEPDAVIEETAEDRAPRVVFVGRRLRSRSPLRTDSTLPAGSMNHAMSGPGGPRWMPFSSCSNCG